MSSLPLFLRQMEIVTEGLRLTLANVTHRFDLHALRFKFTTLRVQLEGLYLFSFCMHAFTYPVDQLEQLYTSCNIPFIDMHLVWTYWSAKTFIICFNPYRPYLSVFFFSLSFLCLNSSSFVPFFFIPQGEATNMYLLDEMPKSKWWLTSHFAERTFMPRHYQCSPNNATCTLVDLIGNSGACV